MRSKKPYRAVAVHALDANRLTATLVANKLVVAIDVAKEKMVGVVAAVDGKSCETLVVFKWDHPKDSSVFYQFCAALRQRVEVDVVLEPTGTYGDPLVHHLAAMGLDIYLVRADLAQQMRVLYDGNPSSHDAKSACILAELHVQGRSRVWQVEDAARRELKAMLGTLSRYSKRHRAEVNQLHAMLARCWPDLEGIVDISTVGCLTLLGELGGPAAICANLAAAKDALIRGSYRQLSAEKIERILVSAQQGHGRPQCAAEVEALQDLARDALETHRKMKAAQKKLEKAASSNNAVAPLGEVVGTVTAAALVAALGPLRNYESPAAVVRALGLTLTERQSGQQRSRLRISKRGSSQARWYLFLAALRIIHRDAVCRAWHEGKRGRDGGSGLRSVIAIMRKLAKALWHVARGQAFDSTKLFDISRLNLRLEAENGTKCEASPSAHADGSSEHVHQEIAA